MNPLFTIGHSNLTAEQFLANLHKHAVQVVADVRSSPHSGRMPWFGADLLKPELKRYGIKYGFLGAELGARRDEASCYCGPEASYELIARLPVFRAGLDRVRKGRSDYKVALMCAEGDPLTCHRTILVCRHLRNDGFPIQHILPNAELENHAAAEERLLTLCRRNEDDLFEDRELRLQVAYDRQGHRIAYRRGQPEETGESALQYPTGLQSA